MGAPLRGWASSWGLQGAMGGISGRDPQGRFAPPGLWGGQPHLGAWGWCAQAEGRPPVPSPGRGQDPGPWQQDKAPASLGFFSEPLSSSTGLCQAYF